MRRLDVLINNAGLLGSHGWSLGKKRLDAGDSAISR